MSSPRGKFVAFEGLEGSGKTTQVHAVGKHFLERGKRVLMTREPGGTGLGDELRAVLLRSRKESLSPMAELLLMEAARAQHFEHVIKNALVEKELILCDRFTDATMAYQGGGRGIDPACIHQLNKYAAPGVRRDLVVFLDLPPKIAIERALQRISRADGVPEDRFEREKMEFHERVRNVYLNLAKKDEDLFFVVDATKNPAKITNQIIERITTVLGS